MDTSETYIKMCEKALKIQVDWKPVSGDFIFTLPWDFGRDRLHVLGDFHVPTTREYLEATCGPTIWLPRQDQLQEMLNDKPAYFSVYGKMVGARHFSDSKVFVSMEQLWLAFVMSEKFGKTWNDEEWISDKG